MDTQNSYFQKKKTVVSFVLSLFVFYIHFRVFSVFRNADGFLGCVFDQLIIFTKVAVPLFFIISGALFYRDYNLRLTIKKWKNRFVSLCIPYLVWNTVWFIIALLGNYTPLGTLLGGVKATLSLENILRGVFLYGYFEPFWFIFQLIIMTAACPLIYLLLRNKWIGLAWIIAVFIALCFGFRFNTWLFPNSNMVLIYLIGAWIGIHHFSFFTERRSKLHALAGFFVYILCCVFHGVMNPVPEWCITFQTPLLVTIISCGAFWIAFDYFDVKLCPQYMSHSFLIYALHSFIGAAISKTTNMILPPTQGYLLLTAIITFPLTIIFICIIGRLLDSYFPLLKRILTGR